MSPLELINEAVNRLGFHKPNLQSTADQNVSFLSVDFSLSQVLVREKEETLEREK